MRILYMHQYFMTRTGVGGTRSYEFARRFVARGHEVSMVTAAFSAEDRRREVDGIDVIPVHAAYADYVRTGTAMSYPRRVAEFARFAAAATGTVLRQPRPDVIYATSPRLGGGAPGPAPPPPPPRRDLPPPPPLDDAPPRHGREQAPPRPARVRGPRPLARGPHPDGRALEPARPARRTLSGAARLP